MPSILLVEDHSVVARTLSRLLQQKGDLVVSSIAATAEDALLYLPKLNVDLVLIDVALPKMNGIDLVAEIHTLYPTLPCLMISGYASPNYVQRSLDAGARGYVIKDNSAGILEGIQHVLNGQIYVSEELRGM